MLSRSKLYTWLKYKKSVLAKFIGFSAATAVTFRLLFHESFAYEKSKLDDDKLIFVLMLTRHGARTPLHIISGLEEVFIFIPSLIRCVSFNITCFSRSNTNPSLWRTS